MGIERKPVRIQRKRTKGWRMPENTVYVGRPSDWGNPFMVGEHRLVIHASRRTSLARVQSPEQAVALFREHCRWPAVSGPRMRRELRGKNLACWCPLDQPCHADVLLEWANA